MIFICSKNYIDKSKNENIVSILFSCPSCKSEKTFPINKSIIKQEKLTTISIPSGMCCNHSFQAFIDCHLNVRGYQKNDFEFLSQSAPKIETSKSINFPNDDHLVKNLILKGNFVEYRLNYDYENEKFSNKEEKTQFIVEEKTKKEKMKSLYEIYEEFWDFINEDNEIFKDFIIKDPKRQQLKQSIST